MADFSLLVGRYCMYAEGSEMYGMIQGMSRWSWVVWGFLYILSVLIELASKNHRHVFYIE